ncbi:hypothetical protein R3P38DRAFT_2985226 [Favolaschia claudopus]|uniref:PWWP domain-containing protein n=1 Tax=Favolaschia claudopus TaxID=2862362 RepID=A0AAW0AX29_9AGAR
MSAKKNGSSAKKPEVEVFDIRDIVLAKVRGFPPWPGMVVDPEAVPKAVSKERPAGKKSNVYCVRFFPAGDYSWLPPKELTRLTTTQINAFINDSAKKDGDLKDGYKTALDPTTWEEEHAANPPPQKKRKGRSKSKKDDDDEEDELVEEEEEEKAGKKRKRAESPAPKKGKAGAKKGGKKKSKATVESEDEAAGDGEANAEGEGKRANKKAKTADDANAQLESDPEALKVRDWRHKLQKTFLSSNKAPPKADEMPNVDALFTTIESYEDITIAYLTFSKIGKVMRHIHLLEPNRVPRDDEYHFRDRAKALVDKWQGILATSKAETAAEGVTEGTAKMDINGEAKEGETEAEGAGDLTVMDVTMDQSQEV